MIDRMKRITTRTRMIQSSRDRLLKSISFRVMKTINNVVVVWYKSFILVYNMV
nr:MAG TPA: hypothetical protein [Caudoviricetes sp.]